MLNNPYSNADFFSFFGVLITRLWGYLTGQLSGDHLVADEIQLLVLCGVAVSGALVGTFLVLRSMTMLANSLSHTILLGIVLVYLIAHQTDFALGDHPGHLKVQWMLAASVMSGMLTAFLTEFLTKTVRLQADASTGLVFTSLFALGIVLVTLFTRNAHIGAEVVMGNVDALHRDDCWLVGVTVLLNVVLIALFYRAYKITTFDPQLARALGYSAAIFNYLLMLQVSLTCVGAFRAVGVLMVLAFITGPVLTARLLTHRLSILLILAMMLGALASILGVAFSRHVLTTQGVGLSTSGLVVCTIALMYCATVLVRTGRMKILTQFKDMSLKGDS